MARIASNDRFHYTAEQYSVLMDTRLTKALSAGIITADDVSMIKAFIESKKGSGAAYSTINKYVNMLVAFRQYMTVPYSEAQKKDLIAAKVLIEGKINSDGNAAIARNTCRDMMDTAKMFFRWGLDDDEGIWSKISEPQLKKVKSLRGKVKSKRIEDIMTADEVCRLIDAADNSRDRAILAIQYECALRAVEIGRMRWGDISQINENESSIRVDEKTDYERHIRVILFNGHLNAWKRDAKNADDMNGFVFMTQGKSNNGKQLRYDVMYDIITGCAERAGITGRKISPHVLRHSRITYMLQNNTPLVQVCMMCWGTEYSPMVKTYSHLGNDDLAKEQRRLAGIKDSDIVQVGTIVLKVCPVCGLNNPPGGKGYCGGCGSPLNEKAIAVKEQITSMADKEIQRKLDEQERKLNDQAAEMAEMRATLAAVLAAKK